MLRELHLDRCDFLLMCNGGSGQLNMNKKDFINCFIILSSLERS